jgi:hypothetical protein
MSMRECRQKKTPASAAIVVPLQHVDRIFLDAKEIQQSSSAMSALTLYAMNGQTARSS